MGERWDQRKLVQVGRDHPLEICALARPGGNVGIAMGEKRKPHGTDDASNLASPLPGNLAGPRKPQSLSSSPTRLHEPVIGGPFSSSPGGLYLYLPDAIYVPLLMTEWSGKCNRCYLFELYHYSISDVMC